MPYGGLRGLRPRRSSACLAVALAFTGMPAAGAQPGPTPPTCPRRVLQVVAHTDDDLLFMNPDVQHDIRRGWCVRTVYLTAGDGGLGARYWTRREAGVRAAYATMAAAPDRWTTERGPGGSGAVLRTLAAEPDVSLVFLRLPDGARRGDGFARTGHGSLRKLWEGEVARLTTVDARPATYTKDGLVAALAGLIAEFRPYTVRVQEPGAEFEPGHDHSDHQAAARFAAAAAYGGPRDLVRYAGYDTEHRPANVSGADLRAKKAAFYAYARYDRRACGSDRTCTGKYALWLRRRYSRATPVTGPLRHAGAGRCAAAP